MDWQEPDVHLAAGGTGATGRQYLDFLGELDARDFLHRFTGDQSNITVFRMILAHNGQVDIWRADDGQVLELMADELARQRMTIRTTAEPEIPYRRSDNPITTAPKSPKKKRTEVVPQAPKTPKPPAPVAPTKKERLAARKQLISDGRRQAGADKRVIAAANRFEQNVENVEYAKLSQDVYHYTTGEKNPPEGWTRLSSSPEELKKLGLSPKDLNPGGASPFRAELYKTDPRIFGEPPRYVLAAKGTTPTSIRDWATNLAQGTGLPSSYYNRMIDISRTLQKATGGTAMITGHSLGGGLASAGSMVTGMKAVTFNAAGLHPNTLLEMPSAALAGAVEPSSFLAGLGITTATSFVMKELGVGVYSNWDKAAKLIKAYKVDGDILTYVQEQVPLLNHAMPDALGKTHKLEAVKAAADKFEKLPGGPTVEKHGMPVVIDAMEKQKAEDEAILKNALSGVAKR